MIKNIKIFFIRIKHKIEVFIHRLKEFITQCKLKFELILIKIKMWIDDYFGSNSRKNKDKEGDK